MEGTDGVSRRRVAWTLLCPRWLMLLVSYLQKTQTLEIFCVVITVSAVAIWTTEYSLVGWYSVSINVNLYYARPTAQGTSQEHNKIVGHLSALNNCIWLYLMFAVATISSTLCTMKSYLYLRDLCVFVCFGVCFYVFLCVYGPSYTVVILLYLSHTTSSRILRSCLAPCSHKGSKSTNWENSKTCHSHHI